ncbi:hypothetical protein ABIF99_000440 [Bradyrhizobium japonicum]|uniref:hypothetical protein n=1 Tax=Bradyrhizobium japonicum TaxID=375 RepID=UPI002227EF25|nr:hypothetical protein [Bradyrhizobium japonicum]
MPADGINVASSNNGGLGMPPFCGQLSALNCALLKFDAFLSGKQQENARLTGENSFHTQLPASVVVRLKEYERQRCCFEQTLERTDLPRQA